MGNRLVKKIGRGVAERRKKGGREEGWGGQELYRASATSMAAF